MYRKTCSNGGRYVGRHVVMGAGIRKTCSNGARYVGRQLVMGAGMKVNKYVVTGQVCRYISSHWAGM